jgi:hypothetical protein
MGIQRGKFRIDAISMMGTWVNPVDVRSENHDSNDSMYIYIYMFLIVIV